MEGRLISDIFRCCHTETEPGDHGFCLSQSHNTDLFPTSREWGSRSSAPYHLRYPEPAIIFLVDKLYHPISHCQSSNPNLVLSSVWVIRKCKAEDSLLVQEKITSYNIWELRTRELYKSEGVMFNNLLGGGGGGGWYFITSMEDCHTQESCK